MDLIYAGRYTEVCDYAWEDQLDLPSGIVHVDTASIPEFFDAIRGRSQKYVVVSPSCDFGVCYQKHNHPAFDLAKWTQLNATKQQGYNDLHMAARINRDRCKETDKYSIKCWSYTEATFNEIPENVVQWFVVNCEVDEPRVIAIPFGIFGNKDLLDHANLIDIRRKLPQERTKTLYINFQFYNTDRADLYYHFKEYFPDYVTCKQQCSFEEFLNDLATHKFVLCPTGNGLDCYRTLETIYMGAIPILERRLGAVLPYYNLQYPLLYYPNLFSVDPRMLNDMYERLIDQWNPTTDRRIGATNGQSDIRTSKVNLDKVLWPHWKDSITACRSKL